MEIDYKAMFEEMAKRVRELLKADEEYFALIRLTQEQAKYTTAVNSNLLKLPKSEQIALLRALSNFGAIAETICKKHNLLTEEDDGKEEAQ